MKGKPEVVDALSEMLKEELAAIMQYFLHGEMQSNWGYKRLYGLTKKQAIGEMKHAEVLIERIVFLEGLPNLNDIPKLNIGKEVKQQFENDLALETSAVTAYNHAIATCRQAGDKASADLLEDILTDDTAHVAYLATQHSLIMDLGLHNYLVEQMGDGGPEEEEE